jgi:hypothetical protein
VRRVKRYSAFGLSIASDIRLPGLPSGPNHYDLSIELRARSDEAPASEARLTVDSGVARFDVPQFGRVTVAHGREVVVAPHASADTRSIEAFLVGPALAIALQQRGCAVFHATAVAIGATAVALLGEKGAGKSTLAAALVARGHALLSDDVVVLDGEPPTVDVLRGGRTLRVNPDVAAALGLAVDELERVVADSDKRLWSPAADAPKRVRLGHFVVVERGDTVRCARLEPSDAFPELVRHTYGARFQFLEHAGLAESRFRQCAALARAVPTWRVAHGDRLETLPSLVDAVESALA